MVKIPEDLRRQLEAALGRPIPEEMTPDEIAVLGREVTVKAPALFRPLSDLVAAKVVQQAKDKPEVRSVPPRGLAKLLFVKDKDGNWVPSRGRYMAVAALVLLAFLGVAVLMMPPVRLSSSSPSSPAAPATPAPPGVAVAPSEPSQDRVASEREIPSPPSREDSPSAAPGEEARTDRVPSPPLPVPTGDLPPPPDYVPSPGEAPAQMEGLTVLYSRNQAAREGAEGLKAAAFYGRPKEQESEGLNLVSKRSPQGETGGGGESQAVSFWVRSRGQDEEREGFISLRGGAETPAETGSGLQLLSPKKPSEGGGGFAFATRDKGQEQDPSMKVEGALKPGEGKPGELQVIWKRNASAVPGGIIPPGSAGGEVETAPPASGSNPP